MKDLKFLFFLIISFTIFFGAVWFVETHPSTVVYFSDSLRTAGKNVAAVFFHESVTMSELNQKYQNQNSSKGKVNLLIVPGHEPDLGGAEYNGLKERDMAVDLSDYLLSFLKNNDHYKITITRDKQDWNQTFSNYFANNWNSIVAFVANQKSQMKSLMNVGTIVPVSSAYHTVAKPDIALRLYGVNKWANENNIDIEIHVHFNDYPRHKQSIPGEYSGITIYVPEGQYSNSTTTRAIAKTVLSRLSRYNAVSNLPKENAGVVEDQDLIAVGSNNNADAASMLIEYGYIYEPQFQNATVRDMTLKDLAYQTYLGLEDFFGGQTGHSIAYDTLMLPHEWQKTISKSTSKLATTDVLALQSALVIDGEYLNGDVSKNDCPRSGIFGDCTMKALSEFQDKYNITGEKGIVGLKTIAKLNSLYGI